MLDKISVIISTFDNASTIQRCIDAIINQSYKNFEAIIIDDGSTDGTSEVCDRISDPRFIVRHIVHSGVSVARNTGLKLVTGKYICFCDGDDYYEPNFLLVMYKAVYSTKSELIVSNFFVERSKERYRVNRSKSKAITRLELIEGFTATNKYGGFVWNKLFKSSIARECSFPVRISIMEDTIFLMEYLQHCHKIYFVNDAIYNYCDSTATANSISIISENKENVKYIESYEYLLANFDFTEVESKLIKAEMCYMAISIKLWLKHSNNLSDILNTNLTCIGKENFAILMMNPRFSIKKKVKTIINMLLLQWGDKYDS